MTTVTGQRNRERAFGPDTFADITGPDVAFTLRVDGIDFDADLTPAQVAAIHDRMTSRDDDDQAKRAQLAADRDALPADCPTRRLYDYLLGT